MGFFFGNMNFFIFSFSLYFQIRGQDAQEVTVVQITTTTNATTTARSITTTEPTSENVLEACPSCIKDNFSKYRKNCDRLKSSSSSSYISCPCFIFDNDNVGQRDENKSDCIIYESKWKQIAIHPTWSASVFLISVSIAVIFFSMFMSNISPLNLPPYNRAVAIVLLLTSIIGLTSLIGLSPKIDPQGPAHANIMLDCLQ